MDVGCASARLPSKLISMDVIPIKLGHTGIKKELLTLAMINNCS